MLFGVSGFSIIALQSRSHESVSYMDALAQTGFNTLIPYTLFIIIATVMYWLGLA